LTSSLTVRRPTKNAAADGLIVRGGRGVADRGALIGAVAFLSDQASVDLAMRELISRSDGRLDVEGATGSMLRYGPGEPTRLARPRREVTATDVALT
jgi:hypothetical protein